MTRIFVAWILFCFIVAVGSFSPQRINIRHRRPSVALPGESPHLKICVASSSLPSFDFELSDSNPTSNTAAKTTKVGNEDGEEDHGTLRYYRQDPEDPNAESLLLSLSTTKRQELEGILEEIHFARRRKEYTKSDQLTGIVRRKFGIRIYNNPPLWTTRKGMAPTAYFRRKQQQQLQQSTNGQYDHPFRQSGEQIRNVICPLSVKDINELLSQHTRAHANGRYEEADAILFELKINGVQCSIERKLWRADGKKTWEEEDQEEVEVVEPLEEDDDNNCSDRPNNRSADYAEVKKKKSTTSASSSSTTTTTEPNTRNQSRRDHYQKNRIRVVQLVCRRADALIRDDFHLARCLLLELQKTYGVSVNDQERTWSFHGQALAAEEATVRLANYNDKTQNNSSKVIAEEQQQQEAKAKAVLDLVPPILFAPTRADDTLPPAFPFLPPSSTSFGSYRCSIHSFPLPEDDDASLRRVRDLIEERASKREEGKYLEADAIRSELWMTYYVGLSDKLRQWSVGGVFDDETDACDDDEQ